MSIAVPFFSEMRDAPAGIGLRYGWWLLLRSVIGNVLG
jgi:hypothetical protein